MHDFHLRNAVDYCKTCQNQNRMLQKQPFSLQQLNRSASPQTPTESLPLQPSLQFCTHCFIGFICLLLYFAHHIFYNSIHTGYFLPLRYYLHLLIVYHRALALLLFVLYVLNHFSPLIVLFLNGALLGNK